jgi:hypothetical protein
MQWVIVKPLGELLSDWDQKYGEVPEVELVSARAMFDELGLPGSIG